MILDETTRYIHFLKTRNEPWEDVVKLWKEISQVRLNNKQEYSNVNSFLDEWPLLKDQRADTLINLDFNHLYPEKSLNFFNNWDKNFDKLLNLKKSDLRDYSLELVSLLDSDDIKDDAKFIIQLKLFIKMLPPKEHEILFNKTF